MNDEPAFPSHGSMGEVIQEGMSLRDYFAAKAMSGLVQYYGDNTELTAKLAYDYADAMLKEREKKQP